MLKDLPRCRRKPARDTPTPISSEGGSRGPPKNQRQPEKGRNTSPAERRMRSPGMSRARSWLHATFVIFPHLAPADELLGHSRRPGPWRAILSHLCQQPVFVAPLSGCLRQALLYFRPDITQQAGKTGYSLTSPR